MSFNSTVNNLGIDLDIYKRVLKDEDEKKIVMIMIPCSKEILFHGDDIYTRSGNEFGSTTKK